MERTEFQNLIDRLEFVHPDSNSLGLAALSKDMGDSAVKEGRYDEAWRHYHDQKIYFFKHANMCKFNKTQIDSLDATVSLSLANVLKLEGKHNLALVHLAYCYCSELCRGILTNRTDNKLGIYFRRCKLKTITLDELKISLQSYSINLQFQEIQNWILELD